MERSRASCLRAVLALFVAAQTLCTASACDRLFYREMIGDFCLTKFQLDMAEVEHRLWCSWPHTMEIYEDVTNCTFQIAIRMGCYWPDGVVDRFFTHIHRTYFKDCALTGRLLHDPPVSVLAPFIGLPVLVTLLMTALVVWRSKRNEGIV